MKTLPAILFIILIAGCTCNTSHKQENTNNTEVIYSYSVLAGLNNSIFSGNLKIADFKTKGDLGLGTYEGLNGEMVFLDGTAWQVLENGNIVEADNETTTPYAVSTFFEEDGFVNISDTINYEKLKTIILDTKSSENYFYAFKITGKFDSILCGGAPKQDKPYTKTLGEIVSARPKFTGENISGTIVGFYSPAYVGEVTLAGFHLHFISDDRSIGGHLIDFKSSDLKISFDETKSMTFDLQDNTTFKEANLKSGQGY